MTRYGMAVDTARCSACNACAMTCKVENNVPETIWWNQGRTDGGEARYTPAGTYPDDLTITFYTYACQHCDRPLCLEVCPSGATIKREDGIVMVDWEVCIGCKSCIAVCPYEGVRSIVDGEPEYILDFAVGDADVPEHQANVMEKCTFCAHRIDRDERPACVDICPAQARYFGDLDDPDSDVAKVLEAREYKQLLPDENTGPNVYLLI